MTAAMNAAHGKPASHGNAGHAQCNQNGELVIDVTVDGLEGEQQKDFERHQRESRRGHAIGGCHAGALLTSGQKSEKRSREK